MVSHRHTHTYTHIYMCVVWAACYINVTLNLWLWVCYLCSWLPVGVFKNLRCHHHIDGRITGNQLATFTSAVRGAAERRSQSSQHYGTEVEDVVGSVVWENVELWGEGLMLQARRAQQPGPVTECWRRGQKYTHRYTHTYTQRCTLAQKNTTTSEGKGWN